MAAKAMMGIPTVELDDAKRIHPIQG